MEFPQPGFCLLSLCISYPTQILDLIPREFAGEPRSQQRQRQRPQASDICRRRWIPERPGPEVAVDPAEGQDLGESRREERTRAPRRRRRRRPWPAARQQPVFQVRRLGISHNMLRFQSSVFPFQHTPLVDQVSASRNFHEAAAQTEPPHRRQSSFRVVVIRQVLRAVVVQGAQDLLQSQHTQDDGGERRQLGARSPRLL